MKMMNETKCYPSETELWQVWNNLIHMEISSKSSGNKIWSEGFYSFVTCLKKKIKI